jgi:hypothetical protein
MRLLRVGLALLLPGVARAQVQDLNHRILGGLGIDAGVQVDTGLYAGGRVASWGADVLRGDDGRALPLEGLELAAVAQVIGGSGAVRLGRGPWLTVAVGVPWVRSTIDVEQPRVNLDRQGFGDLFFEPLRLGWRSTRADAVIGYSVYAPTSPPPATPLARSQWVHELSLGGTVFFDDDRGWRISALASYDHYQRKPDLDVTRGASVQVQGGFGGPVGDVVEVGIAAYGLWQVAPDRGADLPPTLRGLWERDYGLGPEVDVRIPQIRGRLSIRYTWDLGARARPEGSALFVTLAFLAWSPPPAARAQAYSTARTSGLRSFQRKPST